MVMHNSYPYCIILVFQFTYILYDMYALLFPISPTYMSSMHVYVSYSYAAFYTCSYLLGKLTFIITCLKWIGIEYVILHILCFKLIFIAGHHCTSLSTIVFTISFTITSMINSYILLTIVSPW